MIFATCGSSPIQFERMMQALGTLPAAELWVQHGPASPPPCAESFPFLPFGAMVELIEKADVVVSHAGVGSIICAMRAGHVPIVFPRYKRHSETVDDHQAELAAALAQRGTVLAASTADELRDAVALVPPRSSGAIFHADELTSAVRAAIHDAAPRWPWRRRPDRLVIGVHVRSR